jgi:hypothetical protein
MRELLLNGDGGLGEATQDAHHVVRVRGGERGAGFREVGEE